MSEMAGIITPSDTPSTEPLIVEPPDPQVDVPTGWQWELEDVTCGSCSGVNQLHKQPPQWLEGIEGIKWECRFCGAANLIPGTGVVSVLDVVAECGNCHHTFDNRVGSTEVVLDSNGDWDCPDCHTHNRTVQMTETGGGADAANVAN